MPTIAQAINEAAARLRAARVDEAREDSEERRTASLLLGHLLGLERAQLLVRSNEELDAATYRAFIEAVERRAAGEPLQYITGHQEFYLLDFRVTPDVLIPRPETEFLVEQVLALSLAKEQRKEDLLIVDVGTGCGCIAVTLAHHRQRARVIATDISAAALRVARDNALRHRVDGRIEFLEGDLLAALAGRGLEGRVDCLASNPPYVARREAPTLQREVRDWEPHVALFGEEEGLSFYRRLLADGQRFVKAGGYLVCEIGYGQLDAITQMIDESVWRLQEVTADLQQIPRVLTIQRI